MGSDRKQQEKQANCRFGWSTGSGVYKDFLSWKQANYRKTESGRYTGWAQPTWACLVPGAPWYLVPTRVCFLEVSYFPIFLNIAKLIQNILSNFSEPVYLPYHVPPYFNDSGVFRKDSFNCSSSVIVWIILLSTLIGVHEI